MNVFYKFIILPIFLTTLLICQISLADVVFLKNGRKITGDIISETESIVAIKTVLGRMTIKQKDILKIQREEAEITHIRNGDYLMTRGDYSSAITEYEAALRLDPANPDIAVKLSDARRKAAEATSTKMAPDFAKGDEFLTKGYYDSAIKEYKNVVKQHNDDPTYIAEADVKMRNASNILMTKATDLASQQDYNKSFELFQLASTIFPEDIVQQVNQKYEETLKNIFADADQAYDNAQYAKAVQEYNRFNLTYPGEPVRNAVKSRLERVSFEMTYQMVPEESWTYISRAHFSIDANTLAYLANSPGSFQEMDFTLDHTYQVTAIQDNGNADIELKVNKASVTTTLQATLQKQTFELKDLANKRVSGQMTPRGDFVRPIDLAKILYGKGITGERLDQDSFAGIVSVLARFPVIKPGKIKIGDTWTENVNERRSIGPLEMNTSGQIDYTLAGFETIQGRDCVKLTMDTKLTDRIHGTIGGAEGQQQNVDLTLETPFTGTAYIDHKLRDVLRYSQNGEIKMKGQLLGIRTITQPGFGDFGGRGANELQAEGPGAGRRGPLGSPEFTPPPGGGFVTQTQTQSQALPEVTIRVTITKDLTERTGEPAVTEKPNPVTPPTAVDTTVPSPATDTTTPPPAPTVTDTTVPPGTK